MKKVLKRIDRSFFEWNKSVKMKYISHCGPVTYGPRTCSGRGPGVGEPCTKSQNLFYKNKKNILVFNWFNWTWWTKYKKFTLFIFFSSYFLRVRVPAVFSTTEELQPFLSRVEHFSTSTPWAVERHVGKSRKLSRSTRGRSTETGELHTFTEKGQR